ncbi:MAG: helix-turn-helix domain-containing protein [Streptosporangiaceae bacterium]
MGPGRRARRPGPACVRRSAGHARAIRFSTLTRLCEVLDCQPGDLLSHDGAGSAGQPTPGG